jgi:hypothetical protein
MPRSFKVLLPARIRTPRPPEGGPGPLLSWVFLRLSRASTERPGPSFPDPALVCFLRLFSRRRAARHSKALRDGRIAFALASQGNSHEVFHQSPVLGFSRGPWRSPGEPDEAETSLRCRTTAVPGDHAAALLRRVRPERS